jgi:hypothetical protein
METIRNEHLTEAEIEEFACGRLSRDSAPAVLSHLMNCDDCATLLEAEQDLRRDFREAAAEAAKAEPKKSRLAWPQWAVFPAPALAAAAAIALVVLFIPTLRTPDTQARTVNLSAYRGATTVTASASAPLVLNLDLTGLNLRGGADLQVKIVDAGGSAVWQEAARIEGNHCVVNVNRRLDAGVYWVRLARQGETTPEREFQLDIK